MTHGHDTGEMTMTPEAAWAEAMKFQNRPDPYPYFAELRKTPVARVADDFYVVTGYWELLKLAHDPRISSDVRRAARSDADEAQGDDGPPSIIQSDPPDHDRMRRQVIRHFGPPHSPDLIPGMEPFVRQLCDGLLDNLMGQPEVATRFDVVEDYAYPVPVAVICRVLGVPLEDEPRFHPWIADLLAGTDLGPEAATPEGRERAERGVAADAELNEYLAGLIDGFVRQPAPGLLSKLLHDHDGPDGPMSPAEALSNARLLLVAGHDSTVNTITNCVMTLLRNPGTYELLRRRPGLIPRAIEEVQRLQSAVQFFPTRCATADIEVGGTLIPAGATVLLLYGAANRDPRRFADPDAFDPERANNEHFGWGSGIHTCMGGPLARLEVNVALEIFLGRVENPRLVADPPPYRPSQFFRGPRHLLIEADRIVD